MSPQTHKYLLLPLTSISLFLIILATVREDTKTITVDVGDDDNIADEKFRNQITVPDLIEILTEVASAPPRVPVNMSCKPQHLPRYSIETSSLLLSSSSPYRTPDCTAQTELFGERLRTPRNDGSLCL